MYPGWYQEGREGPMEFILKHEKVWKRVGIIGGVYLGMKYLVPLLIPFLVAALTAYWLRPCFLRMEKWFRIKPAVSAGIFLLLAAAGVGLALYFLGSQLWALAADGYDPGPCYDAGYERNLDAQGYEWVLYSGERGGKVCGRRFDYRHFFCAVVRGF